MSLESEKYEVLSRLKEGKDVWLVKNQRDGRLYVRKCVRNYDIEVYRHLMALDLPGLPHIVSISEENDSLVIIEEYIHGMTVDEILEKTGPFPFEDTRQIMLAVCTLLSQLHSQVPPMIHRDIKPSNILIGQNKEVWLLDFNAVRELKPDSNRDTRLMGTPEFAAPEQYGFGQSDVRTDIYGLGVTMNVMLTGELPSVRKPDRPIRTVIEKCIRLEPEDRFGNVDELARVLQNVKETVVPDEDPGTDGQAAFRKRFAAYAEAFSRKMPEAYVGNEDLKADLDSDLPPDVTKSFLPVGFRSRNILHMITAVLGYLFIAWMSITVEWTENGVPGDTFYQIYSGIMWFCTCVFTVFWLGNYRNIRGRFPGCRRGGLIGSLAVLSWGMVLAFLVVVLFALVLSVIE